MEVRLSRASTSFCLKMVSVPVWVSSVGSKVQMTALGVLHWGGIPSVRAINGETNLRSVVRLTTTRPKCVFGGN